MDATRELTIFIRRNKKMEAPKSWERGLSHNPKLPLSIFQMWCHFSWNGNAWWNNCWKASLGIYNLSQYTKNNTTLKAFGQEWSYRPLNACDHLACDDKSPPKGRITEKDPSAQTCQGLHNHSWVLLPSEVITFSAWIHWLINLWLYG